MKKILPILIWSITIVSIVVGLYFTRAHYAQKACVDLVINIDYDLQGTRSDVFLKYDDVRKFIRLRFDSLIGKPMGEINIEELESSTEEIPYVLESDAFKSLNGVVTLNIKQRRAIILVVDQSGSKYYLDEMGSVIPVRMGYPAHVLICNGNIPAFEFYGYNSNQAYKDSILENTVLKDIYLLAKKIDQNEFLQKEITQLYLNKHNEFEMIPLVGRHKIIFGTTENSAEKFEKLIAFYQQAKRNGAWGKYKTVNLKYKEQIVCTKK